MKRSVKNQAVSLTEASVQRSVVSYKLAKFGNIHIEHLEAGVYVLKLFGTKGELLVVQKIVKE